MKPANTSLANTLNISDIYITTAGQIASFTSFFQRRNFSQMLIKSGVLVILLFASFSRAFAASIELQQRTYTETAAANVPLAYEKIIFALDPVNETTLPHEIIEGIEVRSVVRKSRDLVDLFSYAYPSGNNRDRLLEIRNLLDEGSVTLGNFKDIAARQGVNAAYVYDDKEVKDARKKVLKWKQKFISHFNEYREYLQNPLRRRIEVRPRKKLSSFFWGSTDQVPNNTVPAKEIFQVLLRDLVASTTAHYPYVRQLTDPASSEESLEAYHDYRKRARTLVKMLSYFPETAPGWRQDQQDMLIEYVENYGKISDLAVLLEKLQRDGKESKIRKLREEIRTVWNQIQTWEDTNQIDQFLHQLLIRTSSANNRCEDLFSEAG